MFDLDRAIESWCARLDRQKGISKADQDEMEADLREAIEEGVKAGQSTREAYFKAVRNFGNEETVSRQLRAVNWQKRYAQWLRTQPALLSNYLKVAWRNLYKHKIYAAINIFGLVIGITSFLIIMLYVCDEVSYDQFHNNADHIHRVVLDQIGTDGSLQQRSTTPGALKDAVIQNVPEIEQATHLYPSYWGKVLLSNDHNTFHDKQFLYVDNTFFDVFTFQFIQGNAQSALTHRTDIVLTESFAKRFFEDGKALGKTLTFNQKTLLKVSGVITDPPAQSHLKFKFLVSTHLTSPNWANNWGQGHMHTYIKVKPQASLQNVNTKIQDLANTHRPAKYRDVFYTQPLTGINGIHLSPPRLDELTPHSDKLYIQVLVIVALFVLLIAGINYVNLATARSALRAKEIGMRKVVGAYRKTLIYQFLTESILISIIAGFVAISLTEVAFPFFNNLMQKELSLFAINSHYVWLSIATVVLLFGTMAGLYPAFYLSSFKPISVFKKQRASKPITFDLRKSLVVFQFTLSAFLLIGIIIVQKQMAYIQSAKLGFDKDQVIVIRNFRKVPNRDKNFVVRPALETLPSVTKVGACNEMVGLQNNSSETPMQVKGSNNTKGVLWTNIGYHFLETVGIELVDGRNFSPKFETTSSHDVVILNQTAVRLLNVPEPIIGQQITDQHNPPRTIIGVVKDFHFTSLHNEIKPFAFGWTPHANTVAIKISGQNMRETLSQIQETWAQFVPAEPIDFYFVDEAIDQLYRSEQNFLTIFSTMTGLTLMIACLGLFGLAAFTTEQRTKEIGIRKVMGASIPNIIGLLSKDFVKLILIANFIAWPVAYYVMKNWLTNFAYRIDIGIEIFILSGILALSIAGLTVCTQTFKAARTNPVEALQSE